jgi:hypothetical protein
LAGGALGKKVGRRAARGSHGARGGVVGMGIISVPAALGMWTLMWVMLDE